MKTVRFSKVVEQAGKPEVYLLMSEADEVFQKDLRANRIMSLSGEGHGPEYGTVGYDKKGRGQLLVFPKSLKSFLDSKVVGIKYDLFAGSQRVEKKPTGKMAKPRPKPLRTPKNKKKLEPAKTEIVVPRTTPKAKKVIAFPGAKRAKVAAENPKLMAGIRRALKALEKGNSVAAYNLLKGLVAD